MTWLLTLVLLTAIFSWTLTHKYQEEIIDLKKQHDKDIKDYENELYDRVSENLELVEKIAELKRRGH